MLVNHGLLVSALVDFVHHALDRLRAQEVGRILVDSHRGLELRVEFSRDGSPGLAGRLRDCGRLDRTVSDRFNLGFGLISVGGYVFRVVDCDCLLGSPIHGD